MPLRPEPIRVARRRETNRTARMLSRNEKPEQPRKGRPRAGELDLLLDASVAHSQPSFSRLGNVGRSARLFVVHSLGGPDRCCRDGLLAGLYECEWSH